MIFQLIDIHIDYPMLTLMLTKCIEVDDGATTPFFAIDDSLPHAC